MNRQVAIAIVSGLAIASGAAASIVNSNSPTGDSFTNAGGTNTGQAVGASGWYYNNVRNSGIVGVNGTYARSGNGSVYMETTLGPGGASSKADIELLPSATVNGAGNYSSGAVLGQLSQLTAFGFDWYRSSTSTNNAVQHPSLRLQVISQDGSQFGYLVFERVYNSLTVPTDAWQTDDVYANAATYNLWSTGSLPGAFSNYTTTLQQWMNAAANYYVVGVSAGVGSGWGQFQGAVDNISIGFGGVNTTYNFEVVPTPGAAAVLGLGGLLAGRRRR